MTITIALAGKGGVGKSFFAVNFVQFLRDKGIAHVAIDSDNENSTLKRFHPDVQFLDLANRRELDGIFRSLERANLVVVDCRAASSELFLEYFAEVEVPVVLKALGAGDEKGSTPPMIYALHVLKTLGMLDGWTCYYFGNMEEWCDGIAGHALVEHERLRPDFVVIGEPTRMQVYRGHRGRVEVSVTFRGKTAHASAATGGSKYGASHSANTMKDKLSNTGVSAGTENLL